MTALRLFRFIEPYFCGGLLDDPLLIIRVRPTGRTLMFDCGQLYHLAKRTLRSIDAVFISHAHMDHFMGFDHLVRHTHVSPRPLALYGPPGIAARVGHKLASYDWNLAEPWWRSIFVHELHKNRLDRYCFAGSHGFAGEFLGSTPLADDIIYRTEWVTVAARIVDHALPALAFRLNEGDIFTIDGERLKRQGLLPGPWLRELKRRWQSGTLAGGPLEVMSAGVNGPCPVTLEDAAALYQQLRADRPAASLGYVTDLGFSEDNRTALRELLSDTSLLCCECTFLAADRDKARATHHLCSSDLNLLARDLRPKVLLPMHLSKAYIQRPEAVFGEVDLPPRTRLLRLPPYLTPRPKLLMELPPADGSM